MYAISSFNDSNRVIGQRIRAKRRQWGLSQEALADAIDVSLNYLGEIERGRKPLTLPVAEQLCLLFGVTYDYLFLGMERPKTSLITDASSPADTSAKNALLDLILSSPEEDCQDYLKLLNDVRGMIRRQM
ncbi:MAG: helix-turn-helix transcriptional regulator [Lachnospiraceae bacterium]|nr:helix-turn-helix transcriptional regulator [Lachnospiraceae bacterium]